MPCPFFTIGHSTRSIDDFVRLLRAGAVDTVVDVRTVPRSRANPQYNEDTLPRALAAHGIAYVRMAALGGLRGKNKDVPPETNALWRNRSFHNYADHALSPAFADALEAVRALGRKQRCAVMCAEAVWWRCHRRIVADYLIARGEQVFHLMGDDRVEEAQLTPGARVQKDGAVFYPPDGDALPLFARDGKEPPPGRETTGGHPH